MIHWTQITNIALIIVTVLFAAKLASNIYYIIKAMLAAKKYRKEVEQKHCKKPHQYIKIYIPSLNGEGNICTECGYCSNIEDYFPVQQIQVIAAQRKAYQDYEDWKEKQIEDISMELEMGFDKTEILVNRILGFRRDYQVHYIETKKGGDER